MIISFPIQRQTPTPAEFDFLLETERKIAGLLPEGVHIDGHDYGRGKSGFDMCIVLFDVPARTAEQIAEVVKATGKPFTIEN